MKRLKEINDQNLMETYKQEATQYMFHDDSSFLEKYGMNYVKGLWLYHFLSFCWGSFGALLGTLLALMKLSETKVFQLDRRYLY